MGVNRLSEPPGEDGRGVTFDPVIGSDVIEMMPAISPAQSGGGKYSGRPFNTTVYRLASTCTNGNSGLFAGVTPPFGSCWASQAQSRTGSGADCQGWWMNEVFP